MERRRMDGTNGPLAERAGRRSGATPVTGRLRIGGAVASGLLAGLLGTYCVTAAPAVAQEGDPRPPVFRGAADLRVGDDVKAAFPTTDPSVHRYSVFLTAGAELSADLRARPEEPARRRAGALPPNAKPGLRLAWPGGVRIDAGVTVRETRSGAALERFRAPVAGWYVIEVVPRRGGVAYTLATSGRAVRRLDGLFPAAPVGEASFSFHAPAGAEVSLRVEPFRPGQESPPQIELTGLVAPDGALSPVLSVQRGNGAEMRNRVVADAGRHTIRWTNRGGAGDLRVTVRLDPPAGPPRVFRLGVSEGRDVGVVERGDPVRVARPGYVGSAACGTCHGDLVRAWSGTAHNAAVRAWDRAGVSNETLVNDLDGNGRDDFRDGLDLGTTPAFADFGANAPRLSFDAGAAVPPRVTIGTVSYAVDRVMGGNGIWMQRYLTRIGRTYHVLPFQFDEQQGRYAPYRTEDWYDGSNAPRFTAASQAPQDHTFEAQCSGCHNVGQTVAEGQLPDEIATGYVELNIGCEQCHGPGAAHAEQGDVRKILNPRRLADGTADGARAASDVCARCHSNGESRDALPGTSVRGKFGYRADTGVGQAGERPEDLFLLTDDPADFWGHAVDAVPGVTGTTTVASRADRLHGPDLKTGAHAPDSGDAPLCFDCHDPHRRAQEHQVAIAIDRGVRVATRKDDNSLCLACHAEDAPFAAVPKTDVAALPTAGPSAALVAAVIDHMKDVGMPVRPSAYDPAGTGVGLCTACHMPETPTVTSPGEDAAGFAKGDLHSHRFRVVWPRASVLHGVTNSCSTCHPTDALDAVGEILADWARDADGHAAVPSVPQDGVLPNGRTNAGRDGGVPCVHCHTSAGFVRGQVRGEVLTQAAIDGIVRDAVGGEQGITCDACHGSRSDGAFHGSSPNPLRFPREELCGRCHNAETVTFEDFRDRGQRLRHPQQEMIDGTAGSSPPGVPAVSRTAHSFLTESCLACHYDTEHALGKHDFRAPVAVCGTCHTGLATFDRAAAADYDGDGMTEGVQSEVRGLLDRVRTTLLTDGRITFDGTTFRVDEAAAAEPSPISEAQKRAIFNWDAVHSDGSVGLHNVARAVQLLQGSYRELTGTDVPGAVLR